MPDEDTLPDEDDAHWLNCMDGFKGSTDDESPVLADDGYLVELGDFVIT